MGQRTLTGVLKPARRYRAVYQQWGQFITDLLPGLRHAWRETYHSDTAAIVSAHVIGPRPARRPPSKEIDGPGCSLVVPVLRAASTNRKPAPRTG
jgi:hypothetical protein